LNYHHQGSAWFFWIFLFFRTNDGSLCPFSIGDISSELSGAAVFGVSCDIVAHNRSGRANTTDRREKGDHNICIEPPLKGHLPLFRPCNWPETHLYKNWCLWLPALSGGQKRRPEVAASGLHHLFYEVNLISSQPGTCLGRRKPNPKKIDFTKIS